jgi:hypothetical protein
MRRILVAAVAALAVVVPTSTALARGDGWQPVGPVEPVHLTSCGGANFQWTFPVVRAYFRIVTIGGQEVLQSTGYAEIVVTNLDTGQSLTVNASGPTPPTVPLTAPEFSARGPNLVSLHPTEAASAGLPEMFVNSGYIDITFNNDDTIAVNKLTGDLTDLCKILT